MIAKNHSEMKAFLRQNLWLALEAFSFLSITGSDAKTFLQGQLTCDLNEITPQQSSYAAYCNNKGRVLSILHVIQYQDGYLLMLPTALQQDIHDRLIKIAVFSKVTIRQESLFKYHYGIVGPDIEAIVPDAIKQINTTLGVTTYQDSLMIRLPGITPRFLILSSKSEWLEPACKSLTPGNDQDWLTHDILIGLPRIQPQTIAMFTPQMLNLKHHQAISFSKGCYVGQEIIARTEHLGKAKRSLYRSIFSSDTPPLPGTDLHDEHQTVVGQIVNAICVFQKITISLAVIKIISAEKQLVYLNTTHPSQWLEEA